MIGYKVVRVTNTPGVFLPLIMSLSSGIDYRVGVKTYQPKPHGPLAVFDSIQHARSFASPMYDTEATILKVKYEPSKYKSLWSYNLEIAWKQRITRRVKYCPEGTVLAKWVEPIEEVT